MDNPTWSDIYTPEELAAAQDYHAAIVAKRLGGAGGNDSGYAIANEMRAAAECIRELSEQQAALASQLATFMSAAMDGIHTLGEVDRQIKSSIESLGKLP